MSEKDQKEINLEDFTSASYVNRYVEDVERKLNELVKFASSAESYEEFKTLMLLKKNQETVCNRSMNLKDLIDSSTKIKEAEDYLSTWCNELMIENLKDLIAGSKKIKGAEDYLNTRCNELMIESSKSMVLEQVPRVCTFVEGGLLSESGNKSVLKIQEDHVGNKMNDESDIRGQRDPDLKGMELGIERLNELNKGQKSRNSRLEKVISDQSGYFDLNASTSIKGLKGKIYGLMHEERKSKETLIEYGQIDINVDQGVCTNVEVVEQEMSALMHESKEGLEMNKRWKEWLKDQKTQTIALLTKLSLQLVDSMFFMSERKERPAKFQEVKYLLEWVIEDENSLVLNMIISIMELVNKELREVKETDKVKTESLEGSPVNMEEMEQKRSLNNETQIDQFTDRLMTGFLRLEYIMKHSGLSSFFLRSDESEINEIWKRAVELKIKEGIRGGREGED